MNGIVDFLHGLGLHRGGHSGSHAPASADDVEGSHRLFQVSTLNAIMGGVFDGDLTIGELKRHGDFGVGTFNGLDGELAAIDGEFYRLGSDGSVTLADDALRTPFAVVQWFRPQSSADLDGPLSIDGLKEAVHDLAGSDNYFFGVRVDGLFESITVRVVPRQEKPYPTLLEATRGQSVFEMHGGSGSMIGFRFPDFSQGINMAGLHMHFLADDRRSGGHVLDFEMSSGTLSVDHASDFQLELPDAADFGSAELASDRSREIHEAEGLGD